MKFLFFLLTFSFLCALTAQRRTINVAGFSELSLGIPATLYLKQGADEGVSIDCPEEVFEKIEFQQKEDRLIIRNKERGNWSWKSGFKRSEVDIYVTMKDVSRIGLSGSGVIRGENRLQTRDLRLNVSGSGNMELDLDSEDLDLRISGSGDLRLEGSAEEVEVKISGSGQVRAEDLQVQTFDAAISGSGSCYVSVEEAVSARISGSGNVYYRGNPNRVTSNSSGSGKITKM